MRVHALIGLGSSLGRSDLRLALAVAALDSSPGVEVIACSRTWRSPPMGAARRPFLNAVVRIRTSRAPRGLLQLCKEIEIRLGRRPSERWSDRALDLDLLIYGQLRRAGRDLNLPHPGLASRPFALVPASEIGADLISLNGIIPVAPSESPRGLHPVGLLPSLLRPSRLAKGELRQYSPAPSVGPPPSSRRSREPTSEFAPRSTLMKIFLDTANLDQIREAHSWGIIDGVTTNPSLVAKEGGDFVDRIAQICEIVQGPVSAETVAQDPEGMIREGRLLAQVSEHVVVKVPMTAAGLRATRVLSDEGIDVNVTLCFQAAQALLAAKAGAAYISPFLGRLDDVSTNGVQLIEQIVQIYDNYPDLHTEVLAASIRHPVHVVQIALAGADVMTLPWKVLQQLVNHPLTDLGNAAFLKDWSTVPDPDIVGQVTRWLDKG